MIFPVTMRLDILMLLILFFQGEFFEGVVYLIIPTEIFSRAIFTAYLIIIIGTISGASGFFLAGGFRDHLLNDTCANEIAEHATTILSSLPVFQSEVGLSTAGCMSSVQELKEAKSQVWIISKQF